MPTRQICTPRDNRQIQGINVVHQQSLLPEGGSPTLQPARERPKQFTETWLAAIKGRVRSSERPHALATKLTTNLTSLSSGMELLFQAGINTANHSMMVL